MGNKTKTLKSQKPVTAREENEEEQSEQDIENTPFYSKVVIGSSLSRSNSTTTLPESTLSGKRSAEVDGGVENKKQRRARLQGTTLQDVIHKYADTERASSVEEIAELRRLVATLAPDNANFREEISSIKNQHSSVKSNTTAYVYFDNILV
jgi:hypothetical protein